MISLLLTLLLTLFVPFATTVEETATGSASGTIELEPVPDEVDSFLKNAATAMESYAVTNGSYQGATSELLKREGLRRISGISFEIVSADDLGYCLEANAVEGSFRHLFYYDSSMGRVEPGSCPQ